MKAILEINEETARELLAFHFANPETKLLDGNLVPTDDIKSAEFLQTDVTMEQLAFKPRKSKAVNTTTVGTPNQSTKG